MDGMLFCIKNNRHNVTITTHAIKRHFLIWRTTARQPMKRRCCCVLTIKCTFICVLVNETKNLQHLDCGRSIPATHGGLNDYRLGGAAPGIVLSPIRRRYRATTSRCSGFL